MFRSRDMGRAVAVRRQQLLNVIKEVAIAKVVFTEISLAVLLKNVK